MNLLCRTLIAACATTVALSALAQSVPPPAGGTYVLRKYAIATGGARATGGTYVLTGTVAQAAAGPVPTDATGGSYRLAGGFHTTSAPQPDALFTNGFEN